ncbi:MAG: hypothetical protein U0575_11105 [Phycisphaerales bacterium]
MTTPGAEIDRSNEPSLASEAPRRDDEVRPTMAPATVAGGCLLLMWGIQLGWVVWLAGAAILAIGLRSWFVQVRDQWSEAGREEMHR